MSVKNPFMKGGGNVREAKVQKLKLQQGNSDLLTIVRAYNAWHAVKHQSSQRKLLCSTYYLSDSTMRVIENTRKQFENHLINIGKYLSEGASIVNGAL